MNGECCAKCRYIHGLKHNFERGVGFENSYACDVLLHLDDGEEGWIQETRPEDMCELYDEKHNWENEILNG